MKFQKKGQICPFSCVLAPHAPINDGHSSVHRHAALNDTHVDARHHVTVFSTPACVPLWPDTSPGFEQSPSTPTLVLTLVLNNGTFSHMLNNFVKFSSILLLLFSNRYGQWCNLTNLPITHTWHLWRDPSCLSYDLTRHVLLCFPLFESDLNSFCHIWCRLLTFNSTILNMRPYYTAWERLVSILPACWRHRTLTNTGCTKMAP